MCWIRIRNPDLKVLKSPNTYFENKFQRISLGFIEGNSCLLINSQKLLELSIKCIQSSILIFHSINSPRVSAFRKKVKRIILPKEILLKETKPGNKIINSKSKIKNTMARIKNRIEKGRRPSFKVENPHSKGERNSRLLIIFLETALPAPKRTKAKIPLNAIKKVHKSIQ